MPNQAPEAFLVELRSVMEKNGWGMREVGRRAGVSHTTISNILNLGEQPTFDTAVALAPVLERDPLTTIYLAGLLPAPPDWDPDLNDAIELLKRMDETTRDGLLAFMRRVEQGERESAMDS